MEITIIVDPEFQSLIPRMSKDELGSLEKSLLEEGCRDAWCIGTASFSMATPAMKSANSMTSPSRPSARRSIPVIKQSAGSLAINYRAGI